MTAVKYQRKGYAKTIMDEVARQVGSFRSVYASLITKIEQVRKENGNLELGTASELNVSIDSEILS